MPLFRQPALGLRLKRRYNPTFRIRNRSLYVNFTTYAEDGETQSFYRSHIPIFGAACAIYADVEETQSFYLPYISIFSVPRRVIYADVEGNSIILPAVYFDFSEPRRAIYADVEETQSFYRPYISFFWSRGALYMQRLKKLIRFIGRIFRSPESMRAVYANVEETQSFYHP